MSRSLKFLAASALTLVLASCSGVQTKKVESAEPAEKQHHHMHHKHHHHMKKGEEMMKEKAEHKEHAKKGSDMHKKDHMKKDHMKKGEEMMKEKAEHKKATHKKEKVEDHVTKNVMNNAGHVAETTAGTASAVTKAVNP